MAAMRAWCQIDECGPGTGAPGRIMLAVGGLTVPLLVAAIALGALVGRRTDGTPVARRIWRTIYWANLPLFPIIVAAAPIGEVGPAVLAAYAVLALLVVGVQAYARRRFSDTAERAAFALASTWSNTGWLGPPVVTALLGPDALPVALLYAGAVSAPFNMLVNATLAAAHDRAHLLQILRVSIARNHYLGPVLLGLVYGLAGGSVPDQLLHVAQLGVVAGSFPAFFAFGLVLARTSLVPDAVVGTALVIRLLIAPGLLLATSLLVDMPSAFVLQAGMATGMNVLVLSSEHRLPLRRVVATIFWGTLLVLLASAVYLAFW
jgi:predicted permease